MNKRYKLTISLFALVLSAFALATASTTKPPKVVFIGDYITYEWASVFAANPTELSAWMRPCKSPRRRTQTVCPLELLSFLFL
jgi:hypothetical protein